MKRRSYAAPRGSPIRRVMFLVDAGSLAPGMHYARSGLLELLSCGHLNKPSFGEDVKRPGRRRRCALCRGEGVPAHFAPVDARSRGLFECAATGTREPTPPARELTPAERADRAFNERMRAIAATRGAR